MDRNYFVLINGKDASIPVMTPEDTLAMFGSKSEAATVAGQIPLAREQGFEVFKLGTGVRRRPTVA